MRPGTPTSVITGIKLRETGKAVQFTVHLIDGEPLNTSVTEWFPFSQIDKITPHPDTMIVSNWILGEKGLARGQILAKERRETRPYEPDTYPLDESDSVEPPPWVTDEGDSSDADAEK